MEESPRRWIQKLHKRTSSEVWFGKTAAELPCKRIAPIDEEIFAAYTGPDEGLQLVHPQEIPYFKNAEEDGPAGIKQWNKKNRKAYGLAVSLYDQNPVTKKLSGDPIADCFALCARQNTGILVVADGVNWGEKSKMAARCAVYGSMRHIHEELFNKERKKKIKTTQDLLHVLRKALDAAHQTILRQHAGLTTLCIAAVAPLRKAKQFAMCVVNVGDSLAFVLSHLHGIREVTTGSHDISSERDLRDAGGAVGPVRDGGQPELNNLTFSMTFVDAGDIVFLTTDGISDNFDPVVTKIAVAKKLDIPYDGCVFDEEELECKTDNEDQEPVDNGSSENKTATEITTSGVEDVQTSQLTSDILNENSLSASDTSKETETVDQVRNSIHSSNEAESHENQTSCNPSSEQCGTETGHQSKDLNHVSEEKFKVKNKINEKDDSNKNESSPATTASSQSEQNGNSPRRRLLSDHGLTLVGTPQGPEMLPHERHRYAVRQMEKVLHEYELATEDSIGAQEVCGVLVQHVLLLTNSKRQVLENPDLFGRKLKSKERQRLDQQIIANMAKAPGKLDHATVVAFEVGCYHGNQDEDYAKSDEEDDAFGSDDSSADAVGLTCPDSCPDPLDTRPLTPPVCSPLSMDIPFIDDSEGSDPE